MIMGGRSANDGNRDKVYTLSLKSSVPKPTCLRTICDYPHRANYPIGAVFGDNLPTFCGGGDGTIYRACYKYNYTTNLWGNSTQGSIPSGYKNFATYHEGSISLVILREKHYQNILFTGFSYHENWGLVATPGHDGSDTVNDPLEFSSDGITWQPMDTSVPGIFALLNYN